MSEVLAHQQPVATGLYEGIAVFSKDGSFRFEKGALAEPAPDAATIITSHELPSGTPAQGIFLESAATGLAQWETSKPRWENFVTWAEQMDRRPATDIDRESGKVSIKTLLATMGVFALVGSILSTGAAYSLDQDSSYMKASITKIKPVTFACRADVFAKLDGAGRNKLTFAGHQLPGTGFEASLDGVAKMLTCMQDPNVDVAVNEKTELQTVTIDLSTVEFKTRYDEDRTTVTQETPSISSLGEGLSSILHGLTLGYTDAILENHIQKEQALIEQVVRVSGIKTMETECSEAGWDLIVKAIEQSYADQAKKQHIDPKDVVVKFIGKHPDWRKLYAKTHAISKDDAGQWGYSPDEGIKNMSCSVSPALAQQTAGPISDPGATNG